MAGKRPIRLTAKPQLPPTLKTVHVDPATLFRVSGHDTGAIHSHPDTVDGFLYMSRHKNDEKAVILFDRAAHKLRMKDARVLHKHRDFGQVATDLYIRSVSI